MSQGAIGKNSPADPPTGTGDTGTGWQELRSGDAVTVEPVDGHRLTGWVDTVAEDHSVLWIHLGDGLGRRLFHCQDGIAVRPRRRRA